MDCRSRIEINGKGLKYDMAAKRHKEHKNKIQNDSPEIQY